MRVVNIKELKARLSAYLREVSRGEEFLVTDRSRVVARLGPVTLHQAAGKSTDSLERLARLGARLPVREKRPTDYSRATPGPGMSARQIDALLDEIREDNE